jgi:hypothetical protein
VGSDNRAKIRTERIPEHAGTYRPSVAIAAEANGLTVAQALQQLEAGQTLVTAGFHRRLEQSAAVGRACSCDSVCEACGRCEECGAFSRWGSS